MTEYAKKALIWVARLGGLGVVAMAIQLWIGMEVGAQLKAKGVISKSDYTALETRVGNLETQHDKDVTRIEDKAERIAQILMEGE